MDITWVRELPLWIKATIVLASVLLMMWGILRLKQRNPTSRGVERKLQAKRDEQSSKYFD